MVENCHLFCPVEKGIKMIEVTRYNNVRLTINAELIEMVEETPDTVITFSTGRKIIVKESRQEIRNLVILYKRECFAELWNPNKTAINIDTAND